MSDLVLSWGLNDLPGGSDGKASAYNVTDLCSIPGSGRAPEEGNGNPLQYSFLKSHGQRSLVGCSPWGHKESDTIERLHFHFGDITHINDLARIRLVFP